MTPAQAADRLNGCEYGQEGSPELFSQMKDAGLVAIFGYSDDNMEIRGAADDELASYDGGEAYFTRDGLLVNDCDSHSCPHYDRLQEKATLVEALWCAEPGFSWTYKTDIPHATFEVLEDGEGYCRGIVFALADVPVQP